MQKLCQEEQQRKLRCHLHLFPVTCSLESVAVHILRPLPKMTKGNEHAVVITNRISKLTCAVPVAQIATDTAAEIFFNAAVFPYGI